MNEITIVEVAGELVVDSRIIAEQLENEHNSLMSLLKKHQTKIEAKCGNLRFEIGTSQPNLNGAVHEVKFAWLNEKQSAALLNLCRNSDRAVDLKIDLAAAYVDQKRQLENPIDRKLFTELAVRVASLEENRIAKLETTTPRLAFPRASVDPVAQPIEPLTERAICNRLVREYVFNQTTAQPLNEQDTWRWVYRQLKYRYHYDVYARVKKSGLKSKLDQIAADGKLPELLAICNYFLSH
jgi:phage regulator Rha-like protein